MTSYRLVTIIQSNQKVTKCQTLRRRAEIDLLCVFFLYKDGLTKKEETDRVRLVRETIWNGLELAASFGAFLLAGGTKGKRIALPNAEIMIHQPAIHGNGVNGQVTDIKIVSDQLQKSKQRLNRILAENTGKTIEEIRRDMERDNFMTATEALQYGLIDQVIEKR